MMDFGGENMIYLYLWSEILWIQHGQEATDTEICNRTGYVKALEIL